jgi:hypothetical protein
MTSDLLTRLEYQTIEGMYRLGKLLSGSNEIAVYETQHLETRQPAWIELRRGDTPSAEHRLDLWREAQKLAQNASQADLLRIYTFGRSTLNQLPVIYLVLERADDSLAGVLSERALTEQETREMLEPTLSTLRFLHKNGYVHGALEPAHILACGEKLKLSSDSLERISDGAAPAGDMWALGLVLVQALTRTLPKSDGEARNAPYVLPEAPEPIRGVIRHCLDPDLARRWTAEQALEYLHFPAEKRKVPAEANGRPAMAPPAVVRAAAPTLVKTRKRNTTIDKKWIYGPLAAIVLIAAVIGLSRRADRAPAAAPAAEASTAPAPVVTTPEPEAPKSPEVTRSPTPPATDARPRDRKADGWAVVVGAYTARGPAEKRAREMSKKWPKFKVDVFEPASEKAGHMVVIGTNLSEDAAKALRARAISSGLPRDTYIKRFEPPRQ